MSRQLHKRLRSASFDSIEKEPNNMAADCTDDSTENHSEDDSSSSGSESCSEGSESAEESEDLERAEDPRENRRGENVPLLRPREAPSAQRSSDARSSTNDDEWKDTGTLQVLPFTNIPNMSIGPADSPLDFFKLLFNITFVTQLVTSINTHAQILLASSISQSSRIKRWKDTSVEEVYIFLALLFHMGHIKVNRIIDYWNGDELFDLPFKKFMSRDRFISILRNLSFKNSLSSKKVSIQDPYNKKTKPIIDFFNDLMRTLVIPPKKLTIDESVPLWQGKFKIKQIVKGKHHKYGIKIYVLTDSNGICQRIHMCCGSADSVHKGKGHAREVVKLLMHDFLNAGYSLCMDNFYNSVGLAEYLLAKKTYITGTIQAKRLGNPDIVKNKLPKGSCVSRYKNGVCITNFTDKRKILMISTEHSSDFFEHKNRQHLVRKPKVLIHYNKHMEGVERNDQMLSCYGCYPKSISWYKKVIIHIMEVMFLNAYYLHNVSKALNKDKLSYLDFRLSVVRLLLGTSKSTDPRQARLTENKIHVLRHLPKGYNGKTKRRECHHCRHQFNIRKQVLYYCTDCPLQPAFCIDCFADFHKY